MPEKEAWETMLEESQKKEKAMEVKDEIARKVGTLVGRYIRQQIADGYAYYEIIRENKKSVRIQHLNIGDAWVIPYWGSEATIDKKFAEDCLARRDRWSELCSQKNKEE